MTYAEFKTHLADFLWKANDTDLIAALDNLVLMADAELNRKLAGIKRREVTIPIVMTSSEYPLPADLSYIDSVAEEGAGPFSKGNRNQFEADSLIVGLTGGATCRYYDDGTTLYIAGGMSVTNTLKVSLTYHNHIPDFKAADTSWLADEYLDLYTYATLKHTAPYLREDDRLALWLSMYEDALTSVLEDDMFNIAYGGSPLSQRSPRSAP